MKKKQKQKLGLKLKNSDDITPRKVGIGAKFCLDSVSEEYWKEYKNKPKDKNENSDKTSTEEETASKEKKEKLDKIEESQKMIESESPMKNDCVKFEDGFEEMSYFEDDLTLLTVKEMFNNFELVNHNGLNLQIEEEKNETMEKCNPF